MTITQQVVTIGLCVLATLITRFLPFLVFSSDRKTPAYVTYLGKALPAAIFGMLVIYCLKNVSFLSGTHGIPEIISIVAVILLHLYKRNMLLSIAAGTVCYMLPVQFVF